MEDVFVINGEDEASVKSDIRQHLDKVRASSQANNSMENSLANDDSVTIGIMPSGCYNSDSQQNGAVENGGVSRLVHHVSLAILYMFKGLLKHYRIAGISYCLHSCFVKYSKILLHQ